MELKTYFAQDTAGNIISSAIVNVFLQGTTTLATGLTRADGTPLENPFAADGAGRIQFRAPDGYYDVQVSAGSGIIQTLTIQCVDYSEAKSAAQTATTKAGDASQSAVTAKNEADRAEAAADRADVSAEQAQNALNSITGINTNFEQNSREQWRRSLAEAGLTLVSGSFEEGATANSSIDAVWHIAAGQCYTWDGAFPKAVAARSTPATTGGVGLGAWVSVGDASLLARLKSNNTGEGASLVTFENGNTVETLSDTDGAKNIGSGVRSLLARNNDIKHSKDFSTLQDAIDSSLPKNDLLVSPGVYTENVTLGNAQLKGVGGAVVIKPQGDSSTAVMAKLSTPHWQFRHSSNFEIDGTGTTGASGFSYDPTDQYSGRHNLSDAYIHFIDKAIHKPSGNIGNTFRNIGINNCNWGYHASSDTEMHCGGDTLYNFHMNSIGTYAVYLNATIGASSTGGGIGGWWLKDSIIEGSEGGGIYLKNKPGDCPSAPCGISNVWFEAITTADAVNVDGAAIKPRTLHLIDTSIFYAEYSYINSIKLERSNLVTYGCRFDNADGNQSIEIDADSTIKSYDTYLNGSSGKDVIVESIASQTGKIHTIDLCLRGSITKGRLFNVPSGNKLKAIPFDEGTHTWGGNASVTGTLVGMGLHSKNCESFTFPANATLELTDSQFTITEGLWYVWGVNARLNSGNMNMRITGGVTLGGIHLKPDEWVSTFGVAQADASESASLYVTTSSESVLYLADYFVAEFTSQSEAMAFANTRMALQA